MKGLDASFPSLSKVAIHGKCKKCYKELFKKRVRQSLGVLPDFRGGRGGREGVTVGSDSRIAPTHEPRSGAVRP